MEEVALVFMVAGLSSRFGGKIKQFARVGINNETLIEISLNQALKSNFSKIIFIVGEKTETPFKEMFGQEYQKVPVYYAKQIFDKTTRDKPWGTIDAICSAKDLLDCKFIVCNGDDLYGEEPFETLFNHLQNNNINACIGYKLLKVLPKSGTVNRGIFEIKNEEVKSVKEVFNIEKENLSKDNLSGNELTNMNLFALTPETVNYLQEKLIKFKEQHKEDRKKECILTDELNNLIKEKRIIIKIYPTESKWLGITNPEDEEIVKKEIKKLN